MLHIYGISFVQLIAQELLLYDSSVFTLQPIVGQSIIPMVAMCGHTTYFVWGGLLVVVSPLMVFLHFIYVTCATLTFLWCARLPTNLWHIAAQYKCSVFYQVGRGSRLVLAHQKFRKRAPHCGYGLFRLAELCNSAPRCGHYPFRVVGIIIDMEIPFGQL